MLDRGEAGRIDGSSGRAAVGWNVGHLLDCTALGWNVCHLLDRAAVGWIAGRFLGLVAEQRLDLVAERRIVGRVGWTSDRRIAGLRVGPFTVPGWA